MRQLAMWIAFFSGLSMAVAQPATPPGFAKWLGEEEALAWKQLDAQISPADGLPGTVIASPTRHDPYYYKHWVRDSALVMDVLVTRFEHETDPARAAFERGRLLDFARLSKQLQETKNPSGDLSTGGLGEPFFEVDGSAIWTSWGRPQTDGPALRVVTLAHFAEVLLARGEKELVRTSLYDPSSTRESVMKRDIDYVLEHGEDPAFDIWEETRGHHFYNRMVQRKAMQMAARLARKLGDATRAEACRARAAHIATELPTHWDAARGYLVETLDWSGGNAAKTSNLDTAILLGVLHGGTGDGVMGVADDRVIATAAHLWRAFRDLYAINRDTAGEDGLGMAPAIGRYPEDVYEGNAQNLEGSPWALLTFAFAEYGDRLGIELWRRGEIPVSRESHGFWELVSPGTKLGVGERISARDSRFPRLLSDLSRRSDEFFARVRHVATDGHLSEQFNRSTGAMQSAADLTWSYAAYLTATRERSHRPE